MNKEFLLKAINEVFEEGGQNTEMIAEMMEDSDLNYDEDKANKLLREMKAIILSQKNLERLVKKHCSF